MKNEIKEILEYYKKDTKEKWEWLQSINFKYGDEKYIQRVKNHKVLLDYITNLQEENEKLKDLKNLYRKKFISNFCANNRAIKCIKDFLCTEEYIKSEPEATANNYVELLNILQGENNTPENLYKYTPEKGFRLVGDEDVKD